MHPFCLSELGHLEYFSWKETLKIKISFYRCEKGDSEKSGVLLRVTCEGGTQTQDPRHLAWQLSPAASLVSRRVPWLFTFVVSMETDSASRKACLVYGTTPQV